MCRRLRLGSSASSPVEEAPHDPASHAGDLMQVPERMTVEFIRDVTGLSVEEIMARLRQHGIPCDNHIVNRSDIPRHLTMYDVLALKRGDDA